VVPVVVASTALPHAIEPLETSDPMFIVIASEFKTGQVYQTLSTARLELLSLFTNSFLG
jgi:hypothetical protein